MRQVLECLPDRDEPQESARWRFHSWACSQPPAWWEQLFALLLQQVAQPGSSEAGAAAGAVELALKKPIFQLQHTTATLADTCAWLQRQGPKPGQAGASQRTFLPAAAQTQQQAASSAPPAAGRMPAAAPAVVAALPGTPLPCWRPEQVTLVTADSKAERELLLGAVAVASYTSEFLLQTTLALHLSAQQQLGGGSSRGGSSWGVLGGEDLLWGDLAFVRSLPPALLQQVAQAMLPQGVALSQALLVTAAAQPSSGALPEPCAAASAQLSTALGVRVPWLSQPGSAAAAGGQPRLLSVPRPVLLASSAAERSVGSHLQPAEAPASTAARLRCELILWEAFFVQLRTSGQDLQEGDIKAGSTIWPRASIEAAVQHAAASGELLPAFQDLCQRAAQAAELVVQCLPPALLAMVCSTPIPGSSHVQPAGAAAQKLQQAAAPVSQAFSQDLFGAEAPFTVVVPEHCRGLAGQLGVQLEHSFDGCVAALGFLVQSGCRDVDRWVAGCMLSGSRAGGA